MSRPTLSTIPAHTLHTPHSVKRLYWRPGAENATELAVVPFTPGISPLGRVLFDDPPTAGGASKFDKLDMDADRIEVWDIRREYISKYVLLGGEGSVAGKPDMRKTICIANMYSFE